MTPAFAFPAPYTRRRYSTRTLPRPRRPRDVGLPLPSKMLRRDEIKVWDVTPLMLGYRKNGLEDRAICRVEAVDTEWVIIRRKDSGRLVLVNKQRRWEVVDSSEFEGKE